MTLAPLRARAASCTACALGADRTRVVFSSGPPDAALMVVGEAPGACEDRTGIPFVGPSGALLDRALLAAGIQRRAVYACNVVKCRPPGNRAPRPEEAAACREYLDGQLAVVAPRVILALGGPAIRALTGREESVGALRGVVLTLVHGRTPVVPTWHPAYCARRRERTTELMADVETAVARLGSA